MPYPVLTTDFVEKKFKGNSFKKLVKPSSLPARIKDNGDPERGGGL